MAIKFNIYELTRQVFGINGYSPILSPGTNAAIKYDTNLEVIDSVEGIGTSIFGTSIFESIALIDPETREPIYFEDAPLVSVSQKKNIIKSEVTNRPGSVKEYISLDDYEIKIIGLLCNHNGNALPFDKIEDLNNLLKSNQALEVESKLLNACGIFNIVVNNFEFKATGKFINVMPYEISAWSDNPIELSLDDPDFAINNYL